MINIRFLLHGDIIGEQREIIKKNNKQCEENAVLVGTYGSISTGINISKKFIMLFWLLRLNQKLKGF